MVPVLEIEEVEVLMLRDAFVAAMWHSCRECSLLTWLKLRFPWLRLVLYQVVGERVDYTTRDGWPPYAVD